MRDTFFQDIDRGEQLLLLFADVVAFPLCSGLTNDKLWNRTIFLFWIRMVKRFLGGRKDDVNRVAMCSKVKNRF